jgi:uncharacterized membrane protein
MTDMEGRGEGSRALRAGHTHSHARGRHLEDGVQMNRRAGRVLLTSLALVAVACVAGLVLLWPGAEQAPAGVDYAGNGVVATTATVGSVSDACAPGADRDGQAADPCNTLVVEVHDGPRADVAVPPYVAGSGLRPGDEVRVLRVPGADGGPTTYGYLGVARELPLGVMAVVFVVLVGLVARLRGIFAIAGLGVAAVVIAKFMLPALLAGESAVLVALVASTAIMFVVLYLAHGVSLRTSTALAGTLLGIAATALAGLWSVGAVHLTGVSDETGEILAGYVPGLDYQGLLTAAVIIAGLGVLNDVTITQSSAVWELRGAAPGLSRRALFASAMRIGRDHIASTIYTIVFAYAGTGLAVLLLLSLYDRPAAELLSDESIAGEVVRTLASAIGLVLAVPFTTAIAVLTVAGPRPSIRPEAVA